LRPNFYRRRLTPNFGLSWKVFRRLFLIGATALILFKFIGCVQENLAWQEATHLAALASEDLANDQRELARGNLSLALGMSPRHVKASRSAAYLADLEGDSRAVSYHETILASRDADADDWRRAALSAARSKNGDLALKWAAKYSKMTGDASFPHLVRAELYAAQGNREEQERELRTALADRESIETLNALVAFLLAQNEDVSLHSAEAASLLRRISAIDSGPAGLEALRLALSSGILEQTELQDWLNAYRSHPASNPASTLFVDEIELRLFPDSRQRVFDSVVSRGRNLAPSARVPLALWLLQNDQAASVLPLLPLGDAMQDPLAFQCWINSAIAMKMWAEADDALLHASNPLPPYQTQALQATIAGMRGDSSKSEKIWSEVLASNRTRPAVLLELLTSLTRAGEWKTFYAELPVLLNDPKWAIKTVETLIPAVRQHRDSTLMLEFYRRTLKTRFLVSEALPMDRAAYTRLVLGESVPLEELENRTKNYPENPALRVTYALGLLKSGMKVKALFQLKDVEPPVQIAALLPHQKAVYAAILAANGEAEEAQALIKTISTLSLTRQEEALLEVSKNPAKSN